jgi:hypothetical protein
MDLRPLNVLWLSAVAGFGFLAGGLAYKGLWLILTCLAQAK